MTIALHLSEKCKRFKNDLFPSQLPKNGSIMELMPSSLYARNLTATAHTTTPRAGRVPTDKDDGLSSRKACGLGAFVGRFCLPVGGIGDKTTQTTNFTLENDLEELIK